MSSKPPSTLDDVVQTLVAQSSNPNCCKAVELFSEVAIVTWRGILTKIMSAPLFKDAFVFKMKIERNTCFIIEDCSSRKLEADAHPASYWGHVFEYAVTDSAHHNENLSDFLQSELGAVLRSRLNGINLLYGAEMDCVRIDANLSQSWAELKTCTVLSDDRAKFNFSKYKLPKFWAQSWLAGVDSVIVGERDSAGVVVEVSTFETSALPMKIDSPIGAHRVMKAFLAAFVAFLRQFARSESRASNCFWIVYEAPFAQIDIRAATFNDCSFSDVVPAAFMRLFETQNL